MSRATWSRDWIILREPSVEFRMKSYVQQLEAVENFWMTYQRPKNWRKKRTASRNDGKINSRKILTLPYSCQNCPKVPREDKSLDSRNDNGRKLLTRSATKEQPAFSPLSKEAIYLCSPKILNVIQIFKRQILVEGKRDLIWLTFSKRGAVWFVCGARTGTTEQRRASYPVL